MNVEQIARICHEANRAYCETLGDASQKPWDQAEGWQRNSAIMGVEFAVAHPDAPDSAQHDAWIKDKLGEGWRFGPVKDPSKKEHPCLVLFDQLPDAQRKKDTLFRAIVRVLHT